MINIIHRIDKLVTLSHVPIRPLMEGNIAYDYNLQSLLINGMLHIGFELLLLWFCVLLVVFAALPTPVDIGALFEVVVEFVAVFD